MRIEIRRYGTYVNTVPADRLHKWINDNVPDVSDRMDERQARFAAMDKGYRFKKTK